jgi:hypothetical protein
MKRQRPSRPPPLGFRTCGIPRIRLLPQAPMSITGLPASAAVGNVLFRRVIPDPLPFRIVQPNYSL